MIPALYIVCAVTSIAVTVLLFRGYARSRTSLLLWTALCFVGLSVDNAILVLDMLVFVEANLRPLRDSAALIGMSVLLFALIHESR